MPEQDLAAPRIRFKRVPISPRTRFAVLKRDGFTCQYCGAGAPDVQLHVDHVRPVSKGGGGGMGNLKTACKDCNIGKGVTELDDEIDPETARALLLRARMVWENVSIAFDVLASHMQRKGWAIPADATDVMQDHYLLSALPVDLMWESFLHTDNWDAFINIVEWFVDHRDDAA